MVADVAAGTAFPEIVGGSRSVTLLMSRVVSSACIRTPSSKLRRYGFTSRCTMSTSGFPLARPCEIRVQSTQAIVRALSGKSAATLALSRPKMTNVRSVCRTLRHLGLGIASTPKDTMSG